MGPGQDTALSDAAFSSSFLVAACAIRSCCRYKQRVSATMVEPGHHQIKAFTHDGDVPKACTHVYDKSKALTVSETFFVDGIDR